jgi:molybdopterin-binding protein
VPRAERAQRVHRWLERFGIADLAHRPARALSGGEAQRVSLARALVLEPDVLLMDEPFAALDAPTRQVLIDDLDRALTQAGATAVFVTHRRAEALRLGDRVAVIIGGRIRQVGPPSRVFAEPADKEVGAFLGVETIVPGRVRSLDRGLALVEVAGCRMEIASEVEPGGEVLVCLRPEDVVLTPGDEPPGPTSARNRLPAVVQRTVNAGSLVRIELDAGFPLVVLITKQSLEELSLGPGSRVAASFKATAAHLIPRHGR